MPAASGDQQLPQSEQVFISYSRKDKDFVRRLDEELKRRDREAWVDWEGIPPGDTWEKAIYGAIEATHTFIFVLTPDSIASEVCGREIAHAVANNKRLVPIVHRDVAAERVPKSLGELNWIFFRDSDDFEEATGKLISALDTDLKWVRAHARLLTRAIEWDANGRNNSFVLRGEDLRSAERWLAEAGGQKERQPTTLQTEYIIASRKGSARRQRFTLGAVTVGFVVAIALAVLAWRQRTEAVKQEANAREAASRANVSLARYSKESGQNAQALAYLAQALRLNPKNREAFGLTTASLTQRSWHVPITRPIRHVHLAQFSPDGQRVAAASDDNTARVWDPTSGKPIGEPMKHDGRVLSVQFSPDSQRVVTASADNTARLWDAASGKAIGKPMKHDTSVHSAQFSPDGQRVVTASGDTAQVWDAASGKPIGEPIKHQATTQEKAQNSGLAAAVGQLQATIKSLGKGQLSGLLAIQAQMKALVKSAEFSPDGQRVVTASGDMAQVWDAASGKPIGEPMKRGLMVSSAQFSPDGQRVVTASGDTAQVWDAASGKPIGAPMKHENDIRSAQFSPDGQRVVTASQDKTARLWDAVSGKPLGEPMKHENDIRSAQFSPDGQRVVTASDDKTARLWDAVSGKPLCEPMKHESFVYSARFSADGQRVVTASPDKTVRLWDAVSGEPLGEPMKHGRQVASARFSPDGQRVVTASLDTTARLWDAANGKAIGEPMKHERKVDSARFSPDGQRVVTASGVTARLWDVASSKPIGEAMKHDDFVTSAQFSSDGQRVVTASADKTARLWDAASGKPIGEAMKHDGFVASAQFSSDGQRVVTASFDNTARVWDARSCKAIGEPMKHENVVTSAQFSPDGRRVVTASAGMTVRLWDAASGKAIGEPMKCSGVKSADFSRDGQRVVTVSLDNTAQIWDAVSGKALGEPMKHEASINSAQFSPDGQRVLTASKDNTARMWNAANSEAIGEPMKHENAVNSAQFSPDGQRVVTASDDNTARLWDAPIVLDKDTREDILLLAELAEATSGVALETVGQAENLKLLAPEQIRARWEKIAVKFSTPSSKMTPLDRFLRWSVADRRTRTISPLSQETVFEWLGNRIKQGTVEGLRSALQVDPSNADVTAHLGQRLADQAFEQGDTDKARRTRGEADFLTSRALKLAPDSEEVKKVRDEVVKLLAGETRSKAIPKIDGIWHDDDIDYLVVTQITQAGDSFSFMRRGTIANGLRFESSGGGTISGQSITLTYNATVQIGETSQGSQGECSGSISGNGMRIELNCRDSLFGTYPVTANHE